ncbi:MAG TPA: hypothetical protein VJ276_24860 [Thermoanaerobaculia bacterium]|nr:hypothetical protein [Thermoanaerobaculia bacterium]
MSGPSEQFLRAFFFADGRHPNPAEARRVFDKVFVEPPTLASLAEVARPMTGTTKVLIIDGHPRSGKTWSAVRVVADLIDELGLSEDEYWTSGMDSLRVAPDDNTDLLTVLRNAADALSGKRCLRVVFFDDILGTNRMRPMGDIEAVRGEIGRYLRWNAENRFIRAMSDDSVLLITGRSLHVTLTKLILGVDIRQSHDDDSVTVLNSRRGLFRTSGKGDPFGTFDKGSLDDVYVRNREFHTFAPSDEAYWLAAAVPLLAFDEKRPLTASQKRAAARTLFGEDLECLAREINLLAANERQPARPEWLVEALASLRASYFVMVAPGLVFLDPFAYEALGVDRALSEELSRSLYLFESEGVFRSGRLPNEMYMLAVDDHLREFIKFAAQTFVALAAPRTAEEIIPPLGLRGFVERALHAGGKEGLDQLLSVAEFKSYADSHQRQTTDPLLHLELTQTLPADGYTVHGAGLAAAFGWSLYNFREVYGRQILADALQDWFIRYFGHYLEPCLKPEHVPDAVVVYSTFLQWVIKICDKEQQGKEPSDWAGGVIDLCSIVSEPMRKNLEMILEDEIVWAANDNLILPPSAKRFIAAREVELMADLAGPIERDDERDVNRFFSLAWHNEWLERDLSERTDRFRKWMSLHGDRLVGLLQRRPELIASNLRYHWAHFVTQRAVWMRDWCFSDNPLEFERDYSGIASGSSEPDDNAAFEEIALAIIGAGDADSVKTILLLAGTRAPRLSRFAEISRGIERRQRSASPKLGAALLHAVFELVRQGFFETFSDETETCRRLCATLLNEPEESLQEAWSSYWESLKLHTHYDVLPRKNDGWRDMQQALRREG